MFKQKGSPRMKRLPDEVLSNIFSHIDAVDLAKLEIVCKQWKNVIRSDQSLWKNINYTNRPNFKTKAVHEINKQLIKLLSRGDGSFNSLTIHIPTEYHDFEAIKMFCTLLPHTNVKHLSIFLWTNEKWAKPDQGGKKTTTDVLGYSTRTIVQAVQECPNLETLSLKSEVDRIYIGICGDSASPMAKCRLKKLYLQGFGLEDFFECEGESNYKMLSQAKTIEIKNCTDLDVGILVKLLKVSRKTVEKFCYDKTIEGSNSNNFPVISMPRLKHLQLQVCNPSYLGALLKCHNLHHLEVAPGGGENILNWSYRSMLKSLVIVIDANLSEHLLASIGYDIRGVDARVEVRGNGLDTFRGLQKALKLCSVKELIVQNWNMKEDEIEIVNLVKSCQNDQYAVKLELLHLKHCMKDGKATEPIAEDILLWLKKNVNDFRYERIITE